jgi:archaellum biogenesis ATPase FlaH
MSRNLQTININSLLKKVPITTLIIYDNDSEKLRFINDVIRFSSTKKKQIVYVDTFSVFLRSEKKPEDMIVIFPNDVQLNSLFSIMMSFFKESVVIIDSYPQIVNVYFGEENKADRLFLYFVSKMRHIIHLLILVKVNSKDKLPAYPIFNKFLYDKCLICRSS